MGKVNITTAQNVELNLHLAPLVHRMVAYMIDWAIVISYWILIMQIITPLMSRSDSELSFLWLLFLLPILCYHLVCEILMNGQSFGKRIMKIKVAKLDGSSPTVGAYLLRWVFRLVDFLIGWGLVQLITSLASKYGQRVGDMVAGTTVIKLTDHKDFLKKQTINNIAPDYKPVFYEASNLDINHIKLIQKSIDVKLNQLNNKPVVAITALTKKKLGIKTNMPDLKFLHTILKDYNYLTSLDDV